MVTLWNLLLYIDFDRECPLCNFILRCNKPLFIVGPTLMYCMMIDDYTTVFNICKNSGLLSGLCSLSSINTWINFSQGSFLSSKSGYYFANYENSQGTDDLKNCKIQKTCGLFRPVAQCLGRDKRRFLALASHTFTCNLYLLYIV